MGTLTHNGNTYEYYLARNADSGYFNVEFDIEITYTPTDLPGGKMDISVYGGFTFEQFSDADYKTANLTDKLHFPYIKDFEKQKFKAVMNGDTLLAGFEQQDGTILPNDKLKISKANLTNTFANTINHLTRTVTSTIYMTSPSQTPSRWCYPKAAITGYPALMWPLTSENTLQLTILTHVFDSDSDIGNNLELEFRLLLYTAGTNTQTDNGTPVSLGIINYWHSTDLTSQIKRSERRFRVDHTFFYKPTDPYIGYTLQFKQIKPVSPLLSNESNIVFTAVQLPD